MKLTELFATKKTTLSFEVFPPKTSDGYDTVAAAVGAIASLHPDYMSVTYGAGGSNAGFAASIAAAICREYGVTALAHFSCITADPHAIGGFLDQLKQNGVENLLALRGDLPEGFDPATMAFPHAADLVAAVKERGDFCVGGACYPEGHPESPSFDADLRATRDKVKAGCDFLTTQMFFDNGIFYNYLYRLRDMGVEVPVVAGIMPVTNAGSVSRICRISGLALPPRFRRIIDRYGDDPAAMKQAGIAFATEQIVDLYANGVRAVHVYAMNKPDVAKAIQNNLSAILGR